MKTYFDYFLFAQAEAWFPVMLQENSSPENDGEHPSEPAGPEDKIAQANQALDRLSVSRIADDICHHASRLDGSRAFSPFMENDRLARLAISGEIAFFFNGQDDFCLGDMATDNQKAVRDHGVSIETLVETFMAGNNPNSGEVNDCLDRIGWNT